MRKIVKASLIVVIFSLLVINSLAATPVKIFVNTHPMVLKNELITKNGSVYISLRDIGEVLGYKFSWSEKLKTANLKSDKQIIALQPNNRWYSKMKEDGTKGTFMFNKGDGPIMNNGRIYVKLTEFTIVADGMISREPGTNTYHIFCNSDLQYADNVQGQAYIGNGTKGNQDGAIENATLQYAQSVCRTEDKAVYIADAGAIRKISKGSIKTIKTTPAQAKIIGLRSYGKDVYAMSKAYENDTKAKVYSIFKLEGNKLKEIYTRPADKEQLIDFTVVSDKQLAVLRHVKEGNARYLDLVNLDMNISVDSMVIDEHFNCVTTDGEQIYLGNRDRATIYAYDLAKKKMKLFAGADGEHLFQDGAKARYCAPRRLKYANGKLYVLDYNIIRQITINKGKAEMCQTLAGKVHADNQLTTSIGAGKNMILSPINPIDFDVNEDDILLTDAEKRMMVEIR